MAQRSLPPVGPGETLATAEGGSFRSLPFFLDSSGDPVSQRDLSFEAPHCDGGTPAESETPVKPTVLNN